MYKIRHSIGEEPGKLIVPLVIETLHFVHKAILHLMRLYEAAQCSGVDKEFGKRIFHLDGSIPDSDLGLLFFFGFTRSQQRTENGKNEYDPHPAK